MAEYNDKPARPPAELPRKYGWMLLGWSLLIGGSVLWDRQQETQHTLQSAAAAARANISKDLIFRRWATSHGGVYVAPTEHTPPNPYLKVPDRDVVTTTGKKLTLMNPAYVMREVQQDFADEYGTRSHITSLKLLNPKNAPDPWEAETLRTFEHGAKERLEMQQLDGQPYLRLMRPLIAEPGCLKCHGIQGYKAGDIRGGISTSIPMTPYLARERELNESQALTHGVIWLIGLAGLGFAYRRDHKAIGKQRQTADELQEKEERLALATLHNGVGIWDWNLVTQEMIWDDSMYALYHIRREDFSGTEEAWRKSLHPDDLARGDREVEDAIAGRKPFDTEFRVVWPDGEIRHIKAVAKIFRDEHGMPLRMLGTNMDITERKLAETKLRELNNDFVTLLENTGDFIYFKDQDSRFVFCSQTLADITGHKSWRDMVGKHDLEVFPEETARVYYEEELPIFRQGRPLLNKTDPYYDAQGKRRWVNTNKWPVFDDDGKTVIGIFGISRDITELKEAEDKLAELNRDLERRVTERTEQLATANKELEAFSYSVSHDLRTPLRAIDGFSRILLEDYAEKLDDEGRRLLNIVRDNAQQMGHLIDDILKFSRTGRAEMALAEVDMARLAHEVYEELRPSFAGPEPRLEIGSLPPAVGDRALLHQVFVNLLSNAIKFSRNSETPQVTVSGSAQGDEIVYAVQDNGAGFDMQYADRLFGVFQRLHTTNEFEGTGIGLAIVKRIVTRHGGRVWAEGRVGAGATIYFALPASQPESNAEAVPADASRSADTKP